jgi:hypothetical protein
MTMNPEMIARFLAAACGDPASGGVDEALQMVGERPELATGNLFVASVMGEADAAAQLLEAGAPLADPGDPDGDPHGRWLLCDASDAVAEVLMRHGAHR